MAEIWWVNHYAVTPDMPGGSRHYDMGSELASRGHHVRVFATDVSALARHRRKLLDGRLYAVEHHGPLDFVWVRSSEFKANNWRRLVNMLSFAQNLRRVGAALAKEEPPDLVIGSSPDLFAAASAEAVARSTRARFVLELRDLLPQAMVDTGLVSERHPLVRIMRRLERRLYRAAEHTITLASGASRYLETRGLPSDRITWIPNGVHLGSFTTTIAREQARAKYGFSRFTAVYTGAHGPNNSLDTIVQAAARMPEDPVEFVLVGDGPAKRGVRDLASSLGLGNMRFLDAVPKSEMPNLLTAADAGIITLLDTATFGFGVSPNKLFDYMASRLPVVCAVPGDMAALVREAGAGVTAPAQNPEALARAVRELSALPETDRATMGDCGRAFVAERFRRESLAQTLDAVLRGVLAQKPPRR